jgi:hypothetical protein
MTSLAQTTGPETESIKYWGYALILLAAVATFFLALRFSGRGFITQDFETLVVYVPTVVCLLVYATKMGRVIRR